MGFRDIWVLCNNLLIPAQIFNFQKAYFILDELLLAGEMQESSKKNVLRVISAQDSIADTEVSGHFLEIYRRLGKEYVALETPISFHTLTRIPPTPGR